MKLRLVLLVLAGTALALSWKSVAAPADAPADAQIERGKYLVNHVAMCVQCHSPHDASGQIIRTKLLHGDAIPVTSPWQGVAWAYRAPHIAGLPGYSKEEAVKLLTTGVNKTGNMPKAPMPPFRMTTEDAEAVVAYLKSID